MTIVLAGAFLVALWLVRPRPMRPRERAVYLSERWQREHLYTDGKQRDAS
jgi:hypothetical protein